MSINALCDFVQFVCNALHGRFRAIFHGQYMLIINLSIGLKISRLMFSLKSILCCQHFRTA